MASDEMLEESGPTGTQEFHPSMDTVSMPGGGSMIWDPTSMTYVDASQERKPLRTQVPGMPDPETFQEKTQNPQFEGVYASIQINASTRMVRLSPEPADDYGIYSDRRRGEYNTPLVFRGTFDECRQWVRDHGHTATLVSENAGFQAQQYREVARTFGEQAQAETNPTRQRVLKSKEQYYNQLAERVQAQDPAHMQAEHAPPAAQSQGDVYNTPVPKRNPSMTDDSFSGTISHHIPKVTSMLNTGRNSYIAPETPNLRDCPDGGCGGKMMDSGDESHCHDCGHKEKVHYAAPKTAAFLAPLIAPAVEGLAAGGAGEAAAGALGSGGLTNALRAGSLMQRVMGGGPSEASSAVSGGESEAAGSSVADDNMKQGGFMDDSWADFDAQHGDHGSNGVGFGSEKVDPNAPWDGTPSFERTGDPWADVGLAEEKLHFGEITKREYDALVQVAAISGGEGWSNSYDDGGEGDEPYERDPSRTGSSISDEEGLYGNNQTGHDSEPDSGNKASEGQDQAADELVGDSEGDAGGSAAKDGEAAFALFLEHEPHLESIADNDDSHEDPIAQQVHEALKAALGDDYLTKAARYEISKIAGGTCPTCHIDLTTAQQCGGAPSIQCPVGLAHAGAQVGMQGGPAPMIGQPTSKTADVFHDIERQWEQMSRSIDPATIDAMRDWLIDYEAANPDNKWQGTRWNTASMSPDGRVLMAMDDLFPGGYEDFARQQREIQQEQEPYSENELDRGLDEHMGSFHQAKRPKMCPAHDALVTYALTLQNPAAALQALSGELFGQNSCQGGYEMLNGAGNPTKCKYKPEMVTQEYWDEKEAAAEERKLQREQQMLQQAQTPEQFVDQLEQPVIEPEGQLVGGPELDAQLEAEQVEEKAPVTQDIPDVGGLSTTEDYMPREQGAEIIQFPQRENFDGFQQAASYKWSGPGMLTPELAPSEGPEQMLADTPPEEVPSGSGVSTDDPLDSEGNPLEVGMTYEVQSPMNDDFIPDRYTISAVDPNFIQFEVESQAEKGKGFSFTDTLSTQQIKSDGLRFTPASDSPNASGDVVPSGSSDNTGEGDQPGSVTDLDTGGNSHASSFVDYIEKLAWGPDPIVNDGDQVGVGPDPNYTEGPAGASLEERLAEAEALRQSIIAEFGVDPNTAGKSHDDYQDRLMAEEQQRDRGQMDPDQDEDFGDYHGDGGDGHVASGNPDLDWLNDDNGPAQATDVEMTGNPSLDWLNEDSGPVVAKTAGRDFSPGEQRGFVNEVGAARNLDKLDLSGTHYPDGSADPYADSLWY